MPGFERGDGNGDGRFDAVVVSVPVGVVALAEELAVGLGVEVVGVEPMGCGKLVALTEDDVVGRGGVHGEFRVWSERPSD